MKGEDTPSPALGYNGSRSLEGDTVLSRWARNLLPPCLPAPLLATQRGIIRNIEHTFRTLGSREVKALEVSVGIGRLHLDSCGG